MSNVDVFVKETAERITSFMNSLELSDLKPGVDFERGKKLRGVLVVLISKCLGGDEQKALEYAAAVELVHAGSIIHDDVIDEHKERRKSIPLYLLKGTKWSVLAGDRLFTLANKIASRRGNKEAIEVADAMETILSGVMKEISINEFIMDVLSGEVADKFYFKMIGHKTAGLFKSAAKFGAMTFTDKQSIVDWFGDIGHSMGVAYQIADDLTDIVGMGEGDVEPDLGKVIAILPAVFHYNKDQVKRLPFTVLAGRISVDQIVDAVASIDMSDRMKTDIKFLLDEVDLLVDGVDIKIDEQYVRMLKEYPKYCVNQILAEVGEKI